MTTVASARNATVPDKSTLFCPDCGHQSRFDGDWRVIETPLAARYLCPECHTEITTRTRPDRVTPGELYEPLWEMWDTGLQMWKHVWRQSIPFA